MSSLHFDCSLLARTLERQPQGYYPSFFLLPYYLDSLYDLPTLVRFLAPWYTRRSAQTVGSEGFVMKERKN